MPETWRQICIKPREVERPGSRSTEKDSGINQIGGYAGSIQGSLCVVATRNVHAPPGNRV
jgi:hypothetical protein